MRMKRIDRESNDKNLGLRLCILLLIFGFSSYSWGDYVRAGPLIGSDCSNLGVEVCSDYELVFYKDGDQLHELPKVWPDTRVTSYSKRNSMCYQTLRSEGAGLLSRLFNAVALGTFVYRDDRGKLQEVKPDLLRFKCYKR
jgi:hypothetical protein